MKTINIRSWSAFPAQIAKIRKQYAIRDVPLGDGETIQSRNEILFRGQADSRWGLTTTLERTTNEPYSVLRYWQRADSVVNEIETVTGRPWKTQTFPEVRKQLGIAPDRFHVWLPDTAYLVWLRHHGFPSPLLDWTYSPFVAAFFAMEERNQADRCAVYAFIETVDGGKALQQDTTMIRTIGSYMTTDRRHFSQRASYTVATKWDDESKEHVFARHDEVSEHPHFEQDVVTKLTIPRRDRLQALRELYDFNISNYTLFHSEDALVRSLGLRAFELE